jgi:NADH-ubiquinone oxidoreductase chain 4
MLVMFLIFIPFVGIILTFVEKLEKNSWIIGLITSIVNFYISLVLFILFDFSNIEYQFVQEVYEFTSLNIYLGLDGLSLYFLLLTTFITPIVIVSN